MASILTAQQFFDGSILHGPTEIEIASDGNIVSISEHKGEAEYEIISPGFVDVQMNGFKQWDVASSSLEELKALDNELALHGTTSWLGTIVTAPLEKMSATLAVLSENVDSVSGCIGIHVEGPFLGLAPGAHNPRNIVSADIDWLDALPKQVRLVTLAAENDNAMAAITSLCKNKIIVSLGHSQPTQHQMDNAIELGASMVTHLFNGMSGVHHRNSGLALEALSNEEMFAGVIGDLVHVQPRAISLIYRSKKSERICLVSDSIAWESPWALKNQVRVKDGAPRLPDGTLAGSSTPLAQCVRNAILSCGVPIVDALKSATSTPATLIGDATIGNITIGKRADVVALDENLRVVKTLRRLDSIRA